MWLVSEDDDSAIELTTGDKMYIYFEPYNPFVWYGDKDYYKQTGEIDAKYDDIYRYLAVYYRRKGIRRNFVVVELGFYEVGRMRCFLNWLVEALNAGEPMEQATIDKIWEEINDVDKNAAGRTFGLRPQRYARQIRYARRSRRLFQPAGKTADEGERP